MRNGRVISATTASGRTRPVHAVLGGGGQPMSREHIIGIAMDKILHLLSLAMLQILGTRFSEPDQTFDFQWIQKWLQKHCMFKQPKATTGAHQKLGDGGQAGAVFMHFLKGCGTKIARKTIVLAEDAIAGLIRNGRLDVLIEVAMAILDTFPDFHTAAQYRVKGMGATIDAFINHATGGIGIQFVIDYEVLDKDLLKEIKNIHMPRSLKGWDERHLYKKMKGHSLWSRFVDVGKMYDLSHNLLSALIELKKLGLIHADLKPANILLRNYQHNGSPIMIAMFHDLGAAAIADAEGKAESNCWSEQYNSLERIRRRTEKNYSVTQQDDLYEVAMILILAITGCSIQQLQVWKTCTLAWASAGGYIQLSGQALAAVTNSEPEQKLITAMADLFNSGPACKALYYMLGLTGRAVLSVNQLFPTVTATDLLHLLETEVLPLVQASTNSPDCGQALLTHRMWPVADDVKYEFLDKLPLLSNVGVINTVRDSHYNALGALHPDCMQALLQARNAQQAMALQQMLAVLQQQSPVMPVQPPVVLAIQPPALQLPLTPPLPLPGKLTWSRAFGAPMQQQQQQQQQQQPAVPMQAHQQQVPRLPALALQESVLPPPPHQPAMSSPRLGEKPAALAEMSAQQVALLHALSGPAAQLPGNRMAEITPLRRAPHLLGNKRMGDMTPLRNAAQLRGNVPDVVLSQGVPAGTVPGNNTAVETLTAARSNTHEPGVLAALTSNLELQQAQAAMDGEDQEEQQQPFVTEEAAVSDMVHGSEGATEGFDNPNLLGQYATPSTDDIVVQPSVGTLQASRKKEFERNVAVMQGLDRPLTDIRGMMMMARKAAQESKKTVTPQPAVASTGIMSWFIKTVKSTFQKKC